MRATFIEVTRTAVRPPPWQGIFVQLKSMLFLEAHGSLT